MEWCSSATDYGLRTTDQKGEEADENTLPCSGFPGRQPGWPNNRRRPNSPRRQDRGCLRPAGGATNEKCGRPRWRRPVRLQLDWTLGALATREPTGRLSEEDAVGAGRGL